MHFVFLNRRRPTPKDSEPAYWMNLSVLEGLQRETGSDAGHRQMGWEEARAFYGRLPEPERSRQLENLEQLKLMSDLEEGRGQPPGGWIDSPRIGHGQGWQL